MGEEGTAEIVHKDSSGYFYVTFHGWDPAAVKSGRGVAKTRDFVTWVTDDGGLALPNDSIFSSTDCDKWNIDWAKGGCVGGGEGTMMRSGDYWYHIIEAPDVSLGCLQDQNWVRGDGALDVSLVASLVVSCRLLSSHLISSHLISSHLISSRLASSLRRSSLHRSSLLVSSLLVSSLPRSPHWRVVFVCYRGAQTDGAPLNASSTAALTALMKYHPAGDEKLKGATPPPPRV
jgi:hypothetical protein